jgi:guanine deaminase
MRPLEMIAPTHPLHRFAELTVHLAAENADRGQLPFAAVVVDGDGVVATGVNTALADRDPTAHAEAAAVRAACRTRGTLSLLGATLVSSCEPCAMCHVAALVAGVDRIAYAAAKELVPDLGVPWPAVVAELGPVVRSAAGTAVEHVPVAGSDEPFARFLDGATG